MPFRLPLVAQVVNLCAFLGYLPLVAQVVNLCASLGYLPRGAAFVPVQTPGG